MTKDVKEGDTVTLHCVGRHEEGMDSNVTI